MRKPCAGAPWPSRAARTSHAPLALPEPAACPPTPRRARRSTLHQHCSAFLRLCTRLLASHKRLYPNAPRVRRRFCSTQGAHARPHSRARARTRALPPRSVLHRLPACLYTQHTAPCARVRLTMQLAPRNNSLPHVTRAERPLAPPPSAAPAKRAAPARAATSAAPAKRGDAIL